MFGVLFRASAVMVAKEAALFAGEAVFGLLKDRKAMATRVIELSNGQRITLILAAAVDTHEFQLVAAKSRGGLRGR